MQEHRCWSFRKATEVLVRVPNPRSFAYFETSANNNVVDRPDNSIASLIIATTRCDAILIVSSHAGKLISDAAAFRGAIIDDPRLISADSVMRQYHREL